MSAGASTQTPLGELTALPRPLAGFESNFAARRGWRGRERRTSGRKWRTTEREQRGMEGAGKGDRHP